MSRIDIEYKVWCKDCCVVINDGCYHYESKEDATSSAKSHRMRYPNHNKYTLIHLIKEYLDMELS